VVCNGTPTQPRHDSHLTLYAAHRFSWTVAPSPTTNTQYCSRQPGQPKTTRLHEDGGQRFRSTAAKMAHRRNDGRQMVCSGLLILRCFFTYRPSLASSMYVNIFMVHNFYEICRGSHRSPGFRVSISESPLTDYKENFWNPPASLLPQ
jgi:hypothetical protein